MAIAARRGPVTGPLDTSEISPQILVASRRLAAARRRRGVEDRAAYELARQARRGGQARAVASSYDAIGRGDRAGNVRRCGRISVYACVAGDGCGAVHGRQGYQCHDRLCSYCAVMRGHRLARKVAPLVAGMRRPLFVTVTVRNGPVLAERGKHLRRSLGRLRRGVVFRALIAGGIYVEEITRNAADGSWHPHGHMVVDAVASEEMVRSQARRLGMPEELAARAGYAGLLEFVLRHYWRHITGDSFIVDVRPLQPDDLRELCKYTAKLGDIVYSPASVAEFCAYADGRRMVVPFGNCHGAAQELAELDDEEGGEIAADVETLSCPSCGEVGTMRHQPGRVWQRDQLAYLGKGWFAPCRTLQEWRAHVAGRGAPGSAEAS